MASSDLDAPASVSRLIDASPLSGSLRLAVPAILIFSFALVGTAQCRGQSQPGQDQTNQDVAEAARQERARKESRQKKSKHVYTAEDLKREHILTREDRAEMEARKNQPALPGAPQKPRDAMDGSTVARDVDGPAATRDSDAASLPANAPLGDVARRLRKQKESQRLQRSAEFHLPFADAPMLASPKPPAQPLHPPVTVDPPTVVQPAPPVVAPYRPFVKRSPFERPRVLPPPVPTPRKLAPALSTSRVVPTQPAVPLATTAPSISGKLNVVTVKAGDSLWKFAARYLGDGRRWQELLALNPDLRDPNLIEAGTQIVLPASVASPRAPAKYSVHHGDTLWTIAQTQLGHGAAWSCIVGANPDLRDANLIREGQVLMLPASCSR
jgi:nucleoid-associated protein YgaU